MGKRRRSICPLAGLNPENSSEICAVLSLTPHGGLSSKIVILNHKSAIRSMFGSFIFVRVYLLLLGRLCVFQKISFKQQILQFPGCRGEKNAGRSEEHTSELQ